MMKGKNTVIHHKIWRTSAAFLAAFVLSASISLPVWSDSTEKRVLTLENGSSLADVNGKLYYSEKPIIKKGTVMVPVGVFKKAFGSQIKLEGNSRVRVLHGPHAVVMSIGSTTAWVNGKKIKLPVQPQMVSGTLMVPLRPVAEGIGAKIHKGNNGKLSVSMDVVDKDEKVKNETDIDIDAAVSKTRIGDSYYEWSMNYPSGMIIGGGSDNESVAVFADATGRYYLEVHATPQQVKLNSEDLLHKLVKEARLQGDIVLDQTVVTEAATPYARIVSRDAESVLWEIRGYYANDKVYNIYFADTSAAHYKDLDKHAGLLNSFKPSFHAGDKNLKDLSSIENGLRRVMNPDYGIAVGVPADWQVNHQEMFYGDEEKGYLSIRVTSAPKGISGTLNGWVDQIKGWFEEAFVSESYEIIGVTPVTISDVKGLMLEARYNFGDGWTREYEILLQKNGYRYYLEYVVPEGQEETGRAWEDVLNSLHIDYDVVPANFGRIGEEDHLTDKSKVTVKSSAAYNYHVAIPRYWTAINDRFESSKVEYGFVGGSFEIMADQEIEADYVISGLKQYYKEAASGSSEVKLLGADNITFAGVPAVSLKSHRVRDGISYSSNQIVFESGGVTYTISTVLNDANATDAQKQAIEKALASFELTK